MRMRRILSAMSWLLVREHQLGMIYIERTSGPANLLRNSVNLGTISRPTASQLNMGKDSAIGLGQVNTTDFLFGDEENNTRKSGQQATSPDVKSYLQMNANDDRFPILVSRDTSGLVKRPHSYPASTF
jgi:hypothetical protein